MRSVVRKFTLLVVCLTFWSSVAADARAFCRTTTCERENETCAVDAHGCVVDGAPLYWENGVAALEVAAEASPLLGISAAEFEDATAAAIETWQDATCAGGKNPSLTVVTSVVEAPSVVFRKKGPNENVVVFRDVAWPHETDALAKTSVGFYVSSGIILDADIELNSELVDFTTSDEAGGTDLQAVLTHEIGHVLGLDHSDAPGATMKATTSGFSTRDLRSLSQDDVDAICTAYPPASEEGSGGCAVAPGATRASASTAACMLLLAAAWRRLRRRLAALSPS